MASRSFKSPSPPKRPSAPMAQPAHPHNKEGQGDADLVQSLDRLTITTSSARPTRSPRPAPPGPLKPVADGSPSSPRPASAMRSPFRSSSASVNPPSRSATPTLLRKASMNSLHSANGVAPSRRASFAHIASPSRARSGRSPLRSISPELPEKLIPTAQSVASDHFKAELDIHHGPEPTRRAETVVILQDACYGHRYSRPRSSRATLSSIVERPERIKACVLGVAAAYVRLGERHQDGAFPIHPETEAAALPTIPFRIQRSARRLSLTSQTVTNVHGTKWMEELKMMCDTAEAKLAGGGKELQRPEIDRDPDAEAPEEFHEGDLYLCEESLEALEGALGGVCDAVDAVFRPQGPQRAFVAIRPPGHHCSASHPSGFCWINNIHVGIMHGILSHGLTHAAIIDFDLHHGDGSQSVAWQHNARGIGLPKNGAWWKKTSIGYFSLHDINSYPCEAGDENKIRNASVCIDSAHGQSIWNVHLQPWKTEAEFWSHYETKYAVLLEKARSYLQNQTERLRASGLNSRAAIFLSAGFDASQWEDPGMQRHSVNVPTEFYARFTRDVVRIAAEEGTSVEGRIVSVLEGGYSDRALCSGALSHLCGLAGDGPSNKEQELNPSGLELGPKVVPHRPRKDSSASERGARRYESSWWSAAELEQLEVTLATPPPVPRVVRSGPQPTYSSPTQASAAKMVNPKMATPKGRRSVSGLSPGPSNGETIFWSTPPPPPPTDVPWTIATHELSKLLIPSGRQTSSCTPEELNAEASRVRRDRHLAQFPSAAIPPVPEDRAPTRTGLRDRKPKPAPVPEDGEDRKARRRTVAGPSVLATESASRGPTPLPGKQSRSSGRRLSAASTIVSSEASDPPPSGAASGRGRPESSMSVAGPNGKSLNVKKTRAPAKREPAPRPPRAPKKNATNGAAPQTAPAPAAPAGASSADNAGDDVNKLASEMKKIKITVITKAQKEARERERAAREQLAKAETLPQDENHHPAQQSAAPANTTTTPLSTANPPKQQPLPSPSPSPAHLPTAPIQSPGDRLSNPATPSPEGFTATPPPTDPRRVPLPASSPVSTSNSMDTTMFVPYQPDGQLPVPESSPPLQQQQQAQTLQWLPPNVSCVSSLAPGPGPGPGPSPVKRGELPVFTSESVIPFAVRKEGGAST